MKTLCTLLTLTLVLSACGGSPATTAVTPPSTTTPATQFVSGTVTALSADRQSLTVAGQALQLGVSAQSVLTQSVAVAVEGSRQAVGAQASGARIRVNGDDANELALSVGQRVRVTASGNRASQVDIEKEVRGPISSVNAAAGTLVVAGQTVVVTATTRIELSRQDATLSAPAHTLADLKAGQFAEVSGTRNAAGLLTASSIEVRTVGERREQGEHELSELRGTVSLLNTAAKTFSALGTAVSYSAAVVEGTLANGVQVEVKGTFDSATSLLTAVKVEVEDGQHAGEGAPVAGAAVRLEEKVRVLDTAAKRLSAGRYSVDYAQATVSGTPELRAEVRVVGTLDSTDLTLVHASEVRFKHDD